MMGHVVCDLVNKLCSFILNFLTVMKQVTVCFPDVTLVPLYSLGFTFHFICVCLVYSITVHIAISTEKHRSGRCVAIIPMKDYQCICCFIWSICNHLTAESVLKKQAVVFKQPWEFGLQKGKDKERLSESIPIRDVYAVIFLGTQLMMEWVKMHSIL